jgi:thioredoxin reductase (NADPH)
MHDVVIVGGGPAGLSAAIYLGRAKRKVLVVDSNETMCRWEPHIENYLGFPESISGEELLKRGRQQADRYDIEFVEDRAETASGKLGKFGIQGKNNKYEAQRLLLATGIFHIPPAIPALECCLGHSMFFCKDCDGFRVQGKRIGIFGTNNDTVEYALGMLVYSPCVFVMTNGSRPTWDKQHAKWLEEYQINVLADRIEEVDHDNGHIRSIRFTEGQKLELDTLFTTRGDIVKNRLAAELSAELDDNGEVIVDKCMMTSVPGLYAAGCVTPANCQIIIAAGQGAIAAQSINRSLFEESLENHALRRMREDQLATACTEPQLIH